MRPFLLVLLFGAALHAQSWKCVEMECSNGKRSFSMHEAPSSSSRIPPPAEIDVNGDTYSLKVLDYIGADPKDGRKLMGTTAVTTHEIEIKTGQSLETEKDSVWHECIHAAFGSDFRDYLGKKWSEEQATYQLTPRLLRIVEANPKLIEYLRQ